MPTRQPLKNGPVKILTGNAKVKSTCPLDNYLKILKFEHCIHHPYHDVFNILYYFTIFIHVFLHVTHVYKSRCICLAYCTVVYGYRPKYFKKDTAMHNWKNKPMELKSKITLSYINLACTYSAIASGWADFTNENFKNFPG